MPDVFDQVAAPAGDVFDHVASAPKGDIFDHVASAAPSPPPLDVYHELDTARQNERDAITGGYSQGLQLRQPHPDLESAWSKNKTPETSAAYAAALRTLNTDYANARTMRALKGQRGTTDTPASSAYKTDVARGMASTDPSSGELMPELKPMAMGLPVPASVARSANAAATGVKTGFQKIAEPVQILSPNVADEHLLAQAQAESNPVAAGAGHMVGRALSPEMIAATAATMGVVNPVEGAASQGLWNAGLSAGAAKTGGALAATSVAGAGVNAGMTIADAAEEGRAPTAGEMAKAVAAGLIAGPVAHGLGAGVSRIPGVASTVERLPEAGQAAARVAGGMANTSAANVATNATIAKATGEPYTLADAARDAAAGPGMHIAGGGALHDLTGHGANARTSIADSHGELIRKLAERYPDLSSHEIAAMAVEFEGMANDAKGAASGDAGDVFDQVMAEHEKLMGRGQNENAGATPGLNAERPVALNAEAASTPQAAEGAAVSAAPSIAESGQPGGQPVTRGQPDGAAGTVQEAAAGMPAPPPSPAQSSTPTAATPLPKLGLRTSVGWGNGEQGTIHAERSFYGNAVTVIDGVTGRLKRVNRQDVRVLTEDSMGLKPGDAVTIPGMGNGHFKFASTNPNGTFRVIDDATGREMNTDPYRVTRVPSSEAANDAQPQPHPVEQQPLPGAAEARDVPSRETPQPAVQPVAEPVGGVVQPEGQGSVAQPGDVAGVKTPAPEAATIPPTNEGAQDVSGTGQRAALAGGGRGVEPPGEGGSPQPLAREGDGLSPEALRQRRQGSVAGIRAALKRFRGHTLEDDGESLHLRTPDGSRVPWRLVEKMMPGEEDAPKYIESLQEAAKGARSTTYRGRRVGIPQTLEEYRGMAPEDREVLHARFATHGQYDRAADTITTTHKVAQDPSVAAEEIAHRTLAKLRLVDREGYNKLASRKGPDGKYLYPTEESLVAGMLRGDTGKIFERIRKGQYHIAPNVLGKYETPKERAANKLLAAAQSDGVMMSDAEREAFVNDAGGLSPDVLDDYTVRDPKTGKKVIDPVTGKTKLTAEGKKLAPLVNEGGFSDKTADMDPARTDRYQQRIIDEALLTKEQKIKKAAEHYHNPNADPEMQKAAELVLGRKVAKPEPVAALEDAEPELPEHPGDDVPFAVRKNPDQMPLIGEKGATTGDTKRMFDRGEEQAADREPEESPADRRAAELREMNYRQLAIRALNDRIDTRGKSHSELVDAVLRKEGHLPEKAEASPDPMRQVAYDRMQARGRVPEGETEARGDAGIRANGDVRADGAKIVSGGDVARDDVQGGSVPASDSAGGVPASGDTQSGGGEVPTVGVQNFGPDITKPRYQIKAGSSVVGKLDYVRTPKGDSWTLSIYGPDGKDSNFRYKSFDQAYAAAFKKKPAGSQLLRREPDNPATPQESLTGKTTYLNGDKATYTGKSEVLHGGTFDEVRMLEGPDKGKLKVIPSKEQSDANVAKKQQERKDQQEQFARLHEKPTLTSSLKELSKLRDSLTASDPLRDEIQRAWSFFSKNAKEGDAATLRNIQSTIDNFQRKMGKTTGPQKSLLGERHEGSGIGSKSAEMFGKGSGSEYLGGSLDAPGAKRDAVEQRIAKQYNADNPDNDTAKLFAVRDAGDAGEAGVPEGADKGTLADARKQWEEKGTDSPYFKKWFGESKVVDGEGKPMVMHHGTGSPSDFDSFDPSRASKESLYGSGFYFSADPQVTSGVSPKAVDRVKTVEDAEREASYGFAGYAFAAPEYNLTKPLEDRDIAKIRRWFSTKEVQNDASEDVGMRRNLAEGFGYLKANERENLAKWIARNRGYFGGGRYGLERTRTTRPRDIPVYLNIKNPFDVDAQFPKDAMRKLFENSNAGEYEAFENASAGYRGKESVSGDDLWTWVKGRIAGGKGDLANEILRKAGYDGITHMGGGNYKTYEPHRVFVAFEPEQIKSATGNRGTFDPENPNINYAVRAEPDDPAPAPSDAAEERRKSFLPGMEPDESRPGPTSTKNAVVAEERETRGLPAAVDAANREFGQVWDEAKAKIAGSTDADGDLVRELAAKPRAVTDTENAMLLHRQITLQNDYDQINKAMIEAHDKGDQAGIVENRIKGKALSDKLLELYNVNKAVGTESGRGLNARKMLANADYSLANMEVRKRAANDGKPLTPSQAEEIRALHQKLTETQKAFEDYQGKMEERLRKSRLNQAIDKIVKEPAADPLRRMGGRSPAAARTSILDGLKRRAEMLKAGASTSSFAVRDEGDVHFATRDEGDTPPHGSPEDAHEAAGDEAASSSAADWSKLPGLSKDLQDLARTFVAEGIKEREPLLDAVHNAVKDVLPGLERREVMDAISGYGKYKTLSKDDLDVQMRDLKGQMQQVGKIEDMEKGQAPLKTGMEHRTPSDTERQLIQQVNETKKKLGIEAEDPETQLKSALDSLKTRLKNQITDLETQINSGVKIVSDRAPTPRDTEAKALETKRDELKAQFDKIFADPKMSDEDRVKLAIKASEKSLADYEQRVKDGRLFNMKKGPAPTSAELEAIRARRDAVKEELQHLRDLASVDKKNAARVKALEKSIAEVDEKIAKKDIAPAQKAAPESPEIEGLKKQQATVMRTLAAMKAEAAKKPAGQIKAEKTAKQIKALEESIADYSDKIAKKTPAEKKAADPLDPDVESLKKHRDMLAKTLAKVRAEAKPHKTPEEIALQAFKTRTKNRIAELQERMAKGDFDLIRKPKNPIMLDTEGMKLKADAERVKKQFDQGLRADQLKKRTTAEKTLDFFAKYRRAALLSAPSIVGKLSAAATLKMVSTPLEEMVGLGYSKAFARLADRAPREGGASARAESKALFDGLVNGAKDAWTMLRNKKTDLETTHGKDDGLPPSVVDYFGQVHGALHAIPARAEFERSFQKRAEWNIAHGVDVTDPAVKERMIADAYQDMLRARWGQANLFSGMIQSAIRSAENFKVDPTTGKPSLAGKAAATALRVAVPITRIPANIISETFTHATGLETGLYRVARAYAKGINELPPAQAEAIMRSLKKGTVGTALMALGFLGAKSVGGLFHKGNKRDDQDVPEGSIRIFGHNISKTYLHNPALEALQMGASMSRLWDARRQAEKDHGFMTTAGDLAMTGLATGLDVVQDAPGVQLSDDIHNLYDPKQQDKTIASTAADTLMPQALTQTAKYFDQNAEGNPVRRKPSGIIQTLESNIPGLRNTVPGDTDLKHKGIDDALYAYTHASDAARASLHDTVRDKIVDSDLPYDQQDKLLSEHKITPPDDLALIRERRDLDKKQSADEKKNTELSELKDQNAIIWDRVKAGAGRNDPDYRANLDAIAKNQSAPKLMTKADSKRLAALRVYFDTKRSRDKALADGVISPKKYDLDLGEARRRAGMTP